MYRMLKVVIFRAKKNNIDLLHMTPIFRRILLAATITGILALVASYFFIFRPLSNSVNTPNGADIPVYIATGSVFKNVLDSLKARGIAFNESSLMTTASLMRYHDEAVRAGKYMIKNGMSNREVIGKLRSGNQDAQKVVINNIRMLPDLAGKAARYFESDSLSFLSYLERSETYEAFGLNRENFLTLFLPNTYEMFWTTSPEKFVNRMHREYEKFWTPDRLKKIKAHNLDKTQAYIIASIVEKESNYVPERPTIAGVYLNRLKNGEKLQADPTVVYAVGDFTIKRVLYSHLTYDSPYNTYLNYGLPPGPICMPSLSSLEAVVDAEKHEYLFFCARPDNSGIHVFSKDYAGHLKNAAAFSKWLNERNIR